MPKQKKGHKPADFIVPLSMNGLEGRMLRLPAPNPETKREILFVYGHHSSLERWWGVVQDLNQYGAVTMPDLPGFGGMQSFYKIGEKPDIDTLADYLAAFVKLRYNRKRVTIAGLSFGFVVATRMLQRYPDLVKKVDLLVSVVGFAHHDDFTFSKTRYRFYLISAKFFSYRLPALFFRNVFLHPLILRLIYARTHNARQKFQNVKRDQMKGLMDFEIHLWHSNDVRTYMATTVEFLKLDNCKKRVDLPLWHISVSADRYFDNNLVEQHMRVIFNDFHQAKSRMDTHAPSVIADMKTAAPLIPQTIRRILSER
jgi:pimeloyl-ACP methyl ester carboxylesterase